MSEIRTDIKRYSRKGLITISLFMAPRGIKDSILLQKSHKVYMSWWTSLSIEQFMGQFNHFSEVNFFHRPSTDYQTMTIIVEESLVMEGLCEWEILGPVLSLQQSRNRVMETIHLSCPWALSVRFLLGICQLMETKNIRINTKLKGISCEILVQYIFLLGLSIIDYSTAAKCSLGFLPLAHSFLIPHLSPRAGDKMLNHRILFVIYL